MTVRNLGMLNHNPVTQEFPTVYPAFGYQVRGREKGIERAVVLHEVNSPWGRKGGGDLSKLFSCSEEGR